MEEEREVLRHLLLIMVVCESIKFAIICANRIKMNSNVFSYFSQDKITHSSLGSTSTHYPKNHTRTHTCPIPLISTKTSHTHSYSDSTHTYTHTHIHTHTLQVAHFRACSVFIRDERSLQRIESEFFLSRIFPSILQSNTLCEVRERERGGIQ